MPLHDGRLLSIVRSYVHLGTLTTPSGSYAQEVSRRTQSMLHAYLPLAKSTFGEPSFPIKTRLVLADSLLFTRLTFALGSWDPLPLGLKRSMEAARMRVFRMILGEFRKEGGLSDRAVREKLGVCSFDDLVRRHRLLYASRVARKAPSLLHAPLQNVGGAMIPWTKALVDDLAALKRAAPKKLEELPPFEDAFRTNGRNLSSCFLSTIMVMRWTICLMHWSLVRSVQRGSFLLGPLLFIVQGRMVRKGCHLSSLMVPRALRVSLILEPGCGSSTIWSTLLRNVSRLLLLWYRHFPLSVLVNLQPLMLLNGAEPRKPVSVFSLLVSLAFQRFCALHNVAFFESFDSVELFSGFFRVPRGFTCHRYSSL